ncbi:hypothetical protein M432DRAFT_396096 [Thermoascus aurantiacus ATCC 26904]
MTAISMQGGTLSSLLQISPWTWSCCRIAVSHVGSAISLSIPCVKMTVVWRRLTRCHERWNCTDPHSHCGFSRSLRSHIIPSVDKNKIPFSLGKTNIRPRTRWSVSHLACFRLHASCSDFQTQSLEAAHELANVENSHHRYLDIRKQETCLRSTKA